MVENCVVFIHQNIHEILVLNHIHCYSGQHFLLLQVCFSETALDLAGVE